MQCNVADPGYRIGGRPRFVSRKGDSVPDGFLRGVLTFIWVPSSLGQTIRYPGYPRLSRRGRGFD